MCTIVTDTYWLPKTMTKDAFQSSQRAIWNDNMEKFVFNSIFNLFNSLTHVRVSPRKYFSGSEKLLR